ncbi:MAG: homing endonuclease associated repeat-containing protein [Intestinimonas sp.]
MARMEAERKHHRELLELVRERGIQLGRIPHPKDFQDELGDLAKYYQTWNQVLTAAGIHWEDGCTPSGTRSRSTARCWQQTAGAGAGAGAWPRCGAKWRSRLRKN